MAIKNKAAISLVEKEILPFVSGYHLLSQKDSIAWVQKLRRLGIEAYRNKMDFKSDPQTSFLNLSFLSRFEQQKEDAWSKKGKVNFKKSLLQKTSSLEIEAHTIVLVNGRYSPELSFLEELDERIYVKDLSVAFKEREERLKYLLEEDDFSFSTPFAALNTAYLDTGVFVHIPSAVHQDKPLHLICLGDHGISHPRIIFDIDQGAKCTLIESHIAQTKEDYFSNVLCQIYLGEETKVDHFIYQSGSEASAFVCTNKIEVLQGASYSSFLLQHQGRWIYDQRDVYLLGEKAEATFSGLAMGRKKSYFSQVMNMIHVASDTFSTQQFKGLADEEATLSSRDFIIVPPEMERIKASQVYKALLLSNKATVDAFPVLEIASKDVDCQHGCAVGSLDEKALFYLTSKGLSLKQAKQILQQAFIHEMLDAIKDPALKDAFYEQIKQKDKNGF